MQFHSHSCIHTFVEPLRSHRPLEMHHIRAAFILLVIVIHCQPEMMSRKGINVTVTFDGDELVIMVQEMGRSSSLLDLVVCLLQSATSGNPPQWYLVFPRATEIHIIRHEDNVPEEVKALKKQKLNATILAAIACAVILIFGLMSVNGYLVARFIHKKRNVCVEMTVRAENIDQDPEGPPDIPQVPTSPIVVEPTRIKLQISPLSTVRLASTSQPSSNDGSPAPEMTIPPPIPTAEPQMCITFTSTLSVDKTQTPAALRPPAGERFLEMPATTSLNTPNTPYGPVFPLPTLLGYRGRSDPDHVQSSTKREWLELLAIHNPLMNPNFPDSELS